MGTPSSRSAWTGSQSTAPSRAGARRSVRTTAESITAQAQKWKCAPRVSWVCNAPWESPASKDGPTSTVVRFGTEDTEVVPPGAAKGSMEGPPPCGLAEVLRLVIPCWSIFGILASSASLKRCLHRHASSASINRTLPRGRSAVPVTSARSTQRPPFDLCTALHKGGLSDRHRQRNRHSSDIRGP
jgi:hypothetical protein